MRKLVLLAVTMTLALVGCGKKTAKNNTNAPANQSGDGENVPAAAGGGGIIAAGGIGIVTNPGAALGGGGGGGGAAMAVRRAVRRTSALNDLKQLGELVESMRDPIGKMPTKDAVLAEVRRSLPKVHEAITEGAYVLADPMQPGGLWAYEVDADAKPGIAVIAGRAARSTPDDLQQYFAAMPKTQPAPQQSTPQPAQTRTASVSKKDMEEIRTFIENYSQASGKMPDGMTVYNALVQAQSPAAALVQQQAIYLMQPKTRESVWAVEAKATTQGGMIVTNNGVETVTAAEAKKRLGQ